MLRCCPTIILSLSLCRSFHYETWDGIIRLAFMGVSVFNELSVTRISICLHIFKQLNSVEQRRLDLSLATLFTNHIHTSRTASQPIHSRFKRNEILQCIHHYLKSMHTIYVYCIQVFISNVRIWLIHAFSVSIVMTHTHTHIRFYHHPILIWGMSEC